MTDMNEYFLKILHNFQEQFKFIEENLYVIYEHKLEIGYKSIQDFKDFCLGSINEALSKKDQESITQLKTDVNLINVLCDSIKTFQDSTKSKDYVHIKKMLLTLNRLRLTSTIIDNDGQIYNISSSPVVNNTHILNVVRVEKNIIYKCKHVSDEDAKSCHQNIINLIKKSKIGEIQCVGNC
ncbi:MAG: hypothetical protein Edafosvirus20_17 [Edafosvirus sp.]|uniref:Uncharacterized protein n=1 Tax=Edafosvirus sp. TaxID=2487765 RepID=A0A3G4ZUP1_9VIRU|nr:MAG: hypothetical protein Edafosvirus20_17 [Edafosvirus sp.]